MGKIYRRSDRIRIKIDDMVVTISPLSLDQKTEIQDLIARGKVTSNYKMVTEGITLAVKYSVKKIENLFDYDDHEYKVEIENDRLTDECVNDLFNIELHKKLTMICTSLLSSIPSEFLDINGQKLEGVEILNSKKEPAIPN